MTLAFTDIHHHLVPGMDDGPETLEDARAMLQAAARDGIGRIVATPHAAPGVEPFDCARYASQLEAVRGCAETYGIEVLAGAEIFFTEATRRHLDEGRVPTLAGTQYVLVEFAEHIPYEALVGSLESLLVGGYIPVLAHAERYPCLTRHPQNAIQLKRRLDVRFQVNCATLVFGKGLFVGRFWKKLLDEGLLDAVATDAHNIGARSARMTASYRTLVARCGVVTARRLTGMDGGLLFAK